MTDAAVLPVEAGTASHIRGQLLGASLFPLALFGLLSLLVTAAALYELTSRLVSERDAAEARADALAIAMTQARSGAAGLSLPYQGEHGRTEQVVLVDAQGQSISTVGPTLADANTIRQAVAGFTPGDAALSLTSPLTQDQILMSFSAVPGTADTLVLIEGWSQAMTPALYYQALLAALVIAGALLSLLMLSVSIGRILEPIGELATTASHAVPGSIFRPVQERGPLELRSLIAAFNGMVIQLAEQQAALREYARKALLSQEEERQRLSHELHDGAVQDLVGLVQRLELCQSELDTNPARARQRLTELRALAQSTVAEVRRISNALRPSILQDLGLAAALRFLCREIEQAMPGMQCTCEVDPALLGSERLHPDLELAVFRVAQEAISNVRHHAGPVSAACVSLYLSEGALQLDVQDDGLGAGQPDFAQLVRDGHLGFAGMRERAQLFGGTLQISSPPGSGTRIHMTLPLS